MAPEVLKHQLYDNRADIYSMGTVLHFMLYGWYFLSNFSTPFAGGNIGELLQSIATGSTQKPKHVRVSADTRRLLDAMLQPNAADRISWDELFSLERTFTHTSNLEQLEGYERMMKRARMTWLGVLPMLSSIFEHEDPPKPSMVRQLDVRLAAGLLCELVVGQEPLRE